MSWPRLAPLIGRVLGLRQASHLAMARRADQDIGLEHFEEFRERVPVICNVRPSGNKYLMEDFFYAGGIRGLMRSSVREHLNLDCMTVTGKTLGENIADGKVFNEDVIRTVSDPIYGEGSLAVLRGTPSYRVRHQTGGNGSAIPEAFGARSCVRRLPVSKGRS